MNRIKSVKDLSKNAKLIRQKLIKKNNKVFTAESLNLFVRLQLGCSLRTAQRTIKELHNTSQLTNPIYYKITINS